MNRMDNTLESTVVFSLKKDQDKQFEKITTKLGNQLKDKVPKSKGYDVWIDKNGDKGYIRQQSENSLSMIHYLNDGLKKNMVELEKIGQVTHKYLFGTRDKDVIKSAEMVTGDGIKPILNGVKPTIYDRHTFSMYDKE